MVEPWSLLDDEFWRGDSIVSIWSGTGLELCCPNCGQTVVVVMDGEVQTCACTRWRFVSVLEKQDVVD